MGITFLVFAGTVAADYRPLVGELKAGDVTLTTLSALIQLDRTPDLDIGYGLCLAGDGKFCKENSTVGYGLCQIAGQRLCKVNGSLGYGLCAVSGKKNCDPNGSIDYGLCSLADEPFCTP